MERTLLGADEMRAILETAAARTVRGMGMAKLAIVGIRKRGAVLAERLREIIRANTGCEAPLGSLDITLYRDDFSTLGANPVVGGTDVLFDMDGRKVLLVDDVLYTGRTIRAALDALTDLGRPAMVRLFVLVDRYHRELPIQADFAGRRVRTRVSEMVEVRVREIDGRDEVVVMDRKRAP